MTLRLYPAMDLSAGACVRLKQGDFAHKTVYSTDPLAVAQAFEAAGAKRLHLVDLDGARDPAARQHALVSRVLRGTRLAVQLGGGVRSESEVRALLDLGVDRVVLGSIAVLEQRTTARLFERVGADRITLALDVRLSQDAITLATHGWQAAADKVAFESLLAFYCDLGLTRLLCTDIGRDGMLEGPNLALYQRIVAAHPRLEVIASGGVSSIGDLAALAAAAIPAAVIGRALYEQRINLAEALTRWPA